MPPKRTVRSHNPSARALQAASTSELSRKRAKRSSGPSHAASGPPVASRPSSSRHSSLVETEASSSASGSSVATQPFSVLSCPSSESQLPSLPSGFMDQLVARVVKEVTTRLSSADPIHHSPVASPGPSQGISCPTPGSLTGLSLVVSDVLPPSAAAPVPTAVTSSSVINSSMSPSHQLPGLPLVSSSGLADTVVQGSVAATQSALAGELPVIGF